MVENMALEVQPGLQPEQGLDPSVYIVIGRHKFTDVQKVLLKKAGLVKEAARIDTVKDVKDVIELAKKLGAGSIVVQALPMPLLMQLLQLAKRSGIRVYNFTIEPVALVPASQQCPPEADIEIVDPRSGNKRCSRTVSLNLIKDIRIEVEPVARI